MAIELIIDSDNNVYWLRNNISHNKFGPSFKWPSGSKSWWVNGKLHRLDGPAAERIDGGKEWYINNVEHTYLEYIVAIEQLNTNNEHI